MLKTLRVIANWAAALAVLGLLACQTAVAVVFLSWLHDRPDAVDVLETYSDQQLEAGFEAPVLRGDDPLLLSRKVLLTTAINQRTAQDVAGRLFHLDALDHDAPIDLYLSTSGGWVDGAFTIIDAMHLIRAPVNTHAIGGCYSSGALVLAAGTAKRSATSSAIIMVHANLEDSEEPYSYDRLERARYESFWRRAARLPDDWFPMTTYDAYYLTAAEALELGIIDEVVEVAPRRPGIGD